MVFHADRSAWIADPQRLWSLFDRRSPLERSALRKEHMKLVPMPRSLARLSLVLAVALIFSSGSPLPAGEVHLKADTLLVISSPDWRQAANEMKASDLGQFIADPEIRRILDNVGKGAKEMMKGTIKEEVAGRPEAGDLDPAMIEKTISMISEFIPKYCGALCTQMTGRMMIAFGLDMNPAMPIPVPNLVIEFGGTDEIAALNGEVLDFAAASDEGMSRNSFELNGYQMQSVEADGFALFIGRNEDRFIIGLNRASLEDYLTACEAGTVRLGAQPFYQQAKAAVGAGSIQLFHQTKPIWDMAMALGSMMPPTEGEPSPAEMINSMGLNQFQGFAMGVNWSAEGVRSKNFFGINGRNGLMRLIPSENQSLAPPPFAPSEAISATTARVELSQLIPMIEDLMKMGPEGEMAEFDAGLATFEEFAGVSLKTLLSDLEGTIFMATPAGSAGLNPMGMMMGGGGSLDLGFALKLKSKDRFVQLLTNMQNPEITQGLLSKEEVSGRDLWSMDLPMMPVPLEVTMSFDGDWMLMGTSRKFMTDAFKRADGEARLATNTAYQKALAAVGGDSGMMVKYEDVGTTLSQMADMIRPMLGMVPMFVPDLGAQPELLFFFDPANIPSSATIQKYYGVSVQRCSVTSGGLLVEQWMPRKSGKKEEKKPKSGSVF